MLLVVTAESSHFFLLYLLVFSLQTYNRTYNHTPLTGPLQPYCTTLHSTATTIPTLFLYLVRLL
jgi:hypothetical protein